MHHGLATLIPVLQIKDLVEIGILWVVLYLFLRFLRRTIAGGIFRGPAMVSWVVILGFFLVLPALHLEVLAAILAGAFPVFIMALIVLFQPELRHGIARLGQNRLFRGLIGRNGRRAKEIRAVDEVVRAVVSFAERRIGALIAIERNIDLQTYIDTGVPLDAQIRAETLDTIFNTETVLHDGAVVVRRGRIAAAGCLLPLTERPQLARRYGTRHRAAIGLSEQSDATVIVASEESGQIAIAERGELQTYRDPEWLAAYLNVIFAEQQGLTPADVDLAAADAGEGTPLPEAATAAPTLGRRPPPTARPGSVGWFASEWGLALIALTMAVIVWAVVWDAITVESDPIDTQLHLQTASNNVGFHEGKAWLVLKGPRGELDEARRNLGTPPALEVVIDRLPADKAQARIRLTREMISFPFPTRLVASLVLPEAEVYRWEETAVAFLPPELRDIPEGIDSEITLDPAMGRVVGPAGHVGERIQPDPVSLATIFKGEGGDIVPPEQRIPLTFDDWRREPRERTYRASVELPAVTAIVRFFPTGREEIKNRVDFLTPKGYTVTPHGSEAGFEAGHFKGLFEGRRKDLRALAKAKDAWWYVVRIPADKLPSEPGASQDANVPIEFFHAASLGGLHVRFASQASLIVTITRTP